MKLVVILLVLGTCAATSVQDKWEYDLRIAIRDFLMTGRRSTRLLEVFAGKELPHLFSHVYSALEKLLMSGFVCTTCNIVADTLMAASRLGIGKAPISNVLVAVCTLLKVESQEICQGIIDRYIGTLLYIVVNRPKLTASKLCSVVFQDFDCRTPIQPNWTVNIPSKSSIIPTPGPPTVAVPFKVIQIADLHFDTEYESGSNGNCGDSLCCQAGTTPCRAENAAGYWGRYRNCDAPWYAIENLLNHIMDQHRGFDYVYFTGDIVAHSIWKTNIAKNTEVITKVYQKFKDTFGDVPLYPILGNHETHPSDQFSSIGVPVNSELSTQWIFNLVANLWKQWLPTSTASTILRGGYYTALVKRGIRIIGLNSNVCSIYNFWLLYDENDPFGQLQWLADTLLQAETNNEMVHILSHIPSGEYDCYKYWASQYGKVINRFSHIIAAQFNGHTHLDSTYIYFGTEDMTKPISVAFNGGSFNMYYSDINPNYKVYNVNAITLEVTNFESWMYNLTKANERPGVPPNWFKLYDFKSAYNVPNLKPSELAELVKRMAKDRKLTQDYYRYQIREADPALAKGCDVNCELENLCNMVTSVSGTANNQCRILKQMFESGRAA